jgi:cellulose synthase operon protein C
MHPHIRQFGALLLLASWLGPAMLAAADQAEDLYAVAAGHYAARRWDLAVEQFTAFANDYPDHERAVEANFYLGETYIQLGRFADARAEFQKVLESQPKGRFARQALFRSGEAAYLANLAESAGEDLNRFLAQHAEDELCMYALPYLGELALNDGNMPLAQQHFSEALKRYPEGPLCADCQLGLAKALEDQDRLIEAERLYRKLAENPAGPLADQATYQLGLLYYKAGKHEHALNVWKTFRAHYPESKFRTRVELGMGWALYRLERYGEAQERLAGLVKDDQVGIEAQYWLGLSQRAQEQWKQAAETLLGATRSEDSHPLAPAIHFHAGDSLLHVGDREAANRQFDVVLEHWPTSKWAEDALFGKLQAAYEAGNHGDVDRLTVQYQEQFPESALKSESYLIHAASLKFLSRYPEAVSELDKYLKLNADSPQSPGAWAELVLCHLQLKQLSEAEKAYEQLFAKTPSHALVLPTTHQLAEAAYAAGEKELAKKLFERMADTEADPEFLAKGLSGLAWSKLNDGQLDEATELFQKLVTDHPRDPLASEAAFTRGQIFEQQENVDAALVMYHQVIQEYSQSDEMPDALLRAARIHDKMQQDQQAATLYERLVTEYPKYPQLDAAIYGWAWVLYELERVDEANESFTRLHKEFPQSKYWGDSTYRLAKFYSDGDQYDLATNLLTELVKKDIDKDILAHGLYLQGRIASRREMWEDVSQPMRRLVDELPDSPLRLPAQYSLAEAAYRLNHFEQATELLDALTKQIAGRRETWLAMIPLRRAQIHMQKEQWQDALKIAEQIRTDFPEFGRQFEADYLEGRCLAALAKFDEAREAYLRVINSSEGSKTETAAMAQWMIGESYFHQKNYEQARREFLKTEILYAYPKWQAGALLQSGKCLELLGKWQDATDTYLRLLQKYPDTPFTEEATQRLRVTEQRAAAATTVLNSK